MSKLAIWPEDGINPCHDIESSSPQVSDGALFWTSFWIWKTLYESLHSVTLLPGKLVALEKSQRVTNLALWIYCLVHGCMNYQKIQWPLGWPVQSRSSGCNSRMDAATCGGKLVSRCNCHRTVLQCFYMKLSAPVSSVGTTWTGWIANVKGNTHV